MADKELRRMNRTELIEIIYALEQDQQKLQEENNKLSAELEDRKIRIEQSGSIAEAALSLNHIFEDAQAAADQYLESLQSTEENPEEPEEGKDQTGDAAAGAEQILEDARQQEQDILEEARRQADEIKGNAQKQADEVMDEAQKQADEIMEEARQKAEEFMAAAHKNAEADAARQKEQTDEQCKKERQAVKEYHDRFMQDMADVLKENPELLERVRQMGSAEGV